MSARRLVVSFTLLALGLVVGVNLLAQGPGLRPKVFAVRNARIVTEPGKEIAQGTVVIRDGVIQAVGADVAPPADALVIDGKDLVVYPGFIDAGSSWGIDLNLRRSEAGPPEPVDYASEALAATKADNRKGVTPEFEASTALQVVEDTAEGWRKQGVTARLAAPDGGIFSGQSALVSLSGAAPRETVLRAPVAQHAALKAGFGGFGQTGAYPSTLMGVTAHARQTLLDARHHRVLAEAFERGQTRRPPFDPALTALQTVLQRRLPVAFETDTKDSIHRALDFAEEFNLQPVLTGAAEAWRAADRIKAAGTPVIVTLNLPEQPAAGPTGRRGPGTRPPADVSTPATPATPAQPATPADQPRTRRQRPGTPEVDPFAAPGGGGDDARRYVPKRAKEEQERKHKEELRNAAVLSQKGIPFAFSLAGLDKPEKFGENLRKVIAEGLPPDAALKALTTDAAKILGVEKQLGSIAPGKLAHLVVMTGPFHEAKSQVRYVFSDGVRFEYEPTPAASERPGFRRPEGGRPAEKSPEGRKPDEAKPDDKKPEDKKPENNKPEEKKPDDRKEADKPEPATEIEADRKPKIKTGGNVLLKGGTILTVTGGTVKGDLLVRDGKIAKIGPNLPLPEGVTVIDANGLYVMPGIIDTHCHFAMTGGVNEFTLSVVPEVRVRDIVNSDDVQIYRALAGGVTTGRLLHGSANVIGGQDAVIKLKYGEPASRLIIHDAPRGVKFALGENVKRTNGRFPNTRLGVEAVLVRAFTEAQAYKRQWDEYARAKAEGKPAVEPRRDLRLEALTDVLDGKLFIHCHSYRADEILMLLRVADRFGFKVKSLQHVLEGYKIAPEIAAHGASNSTFSDWWAYKIEAYDAIPYNAALLHEAGADVCLKSDSNELMRHLYQEAAKTMKYGGLSETEALKTITYNAAKQLGLEKRIGSIEEGKDADLAVFNGHPLDSYARCEMTLVDGEVYFQRTNGGPHPQAAAFTPPAGKRGPELVFKKIPTNPQGKYLIRDVTLHVPGREPVAGASVFVDKGKVAAVGGRDLVVTADATVVDATGLHLYPGMIDAGTVLGLTELGSAPETQDYSEAGDFQPDLRASVGINPDSEVIPVTRSNGVLTVVTRPTGGVIAGQSAIINLHGWVPPEMVVKEPAALHVEFPALAPTISGDPTAPSFGRALARKQRDEKVRRVKELFAQAVAYGHARQQSAAGTPVDPRLEALVPYARGERPVIVSANRREDILEALKLADELKIKMILSGGIDAWKVADELKKRDVPVILGPMMVMPQEAYDPYDAPYACAARLHEAGVGFCIRSAGSTNTRNLPYEAAMAASYGLPRDEALKAVTLYPAQILGIADRLGTVEVGKTANLVLTDGDLLQASTQVQALFIAGVPLEPTNKQTRLYERYRQRLQEVKEGKAPLGTKAQ
jgi:imidazolonepropionase-like amidohydrolase